MKQAVIKTGGKQYLVSEGETVVIEKLKGEAGDKISFDEVLLKIDEAKTDLGMPLVEGVKVEAEIVGQGRGEKVTIFKMKAKKGYAKKAGHKQHLTQVKITKIG